MDKKITVAISSVGSGIGQAIINALRMSPRQFRSIGFGNGLFEYGALDCDLHDNVPSIYHPDYVDSLLEKCQHYNVDIIIPGLDDDVLILSKNEAKFAEHGIKLLASRHTLVALCRKKDLISQELNAISDHFIKSINRTDILNAYANGKLSLPFIAKPRDGSGSIGIRLITDISSIDMIPENYIFQELLIPTVDDRYYKEYLGGLDNEQLPQISELSIQYVTDHKGKFLGKLATVNKLKNGVPIEIFPINRREIWDVVDKFIPRLRELGLRGPLNIQGRITDQGIRFFEVNPRFTGLSGLRGSLGFNEVTECIFSWLGISSDIPPFQGSSNKFGVRQMAEKAVSIKNHHQAEIYYKELNQDPPDRIKTLLITGSSGYLGRHLVEAIDLDQYRIWILSSNKENARELFNTRVERYFNREEFYLGNISWGEVDLLIHCGFARPYRSKFEIADSMNFTGTLFSNAGQYEIPAIINLSSQSVYGQLSDPPWGENSQIAPESPYAIAKYATELMLQNQKRLHPQINVSSLRLAGLTGGQKGLVGDDLVSKFVNQAIKGEPLEIRGRHIFERLDIRDAVEGIIKFLAIPTNQWKEVYNFGRGDNFRIEELAEKVTSQVSKKNNSIPSKIIKNIKDKSLHFGMDSSTFYRDTGWQPKYSLSDTIESLIIYFNEQGL